MASSEKIKVVVSQANVNDLKDLVVLTKEYCQLIKKASHQDDFADENKIKEELNEWINHPDYGAFIARTAKGHLLGFCVIFPMEVAIRQEKFAILDRLYVRDAFRRRGVASALLMQAKRFVKALKCQRLQVTFSAFYDLPEGKAFFKACGFYETAGRKRKIAI